MSKELTPLEALKRIRQETIPATYNQDFDKEECCKIIEDALKRLKQIEINQTIFENNPITVGKKIMALEIIKKHFNIEDFQEFISLDGRLYKELHKEEYNLLKEELL